MYPYVLFVFLKSCDHYALFMLFLKLVSLQVLHLKSFICMLYLVLAYVLSMQTVCCIDLMGEFLVYDDEKKGILQLGRFLEIVLEMGSSHSANARSVKKKKDQKSESKKQNAISKQSCRTAQQRKQSWVLHIEASKDRSWPPFVLFCAAKTPDGRNRRSSATISVVLLRRKPRLILVLPR